jgi:hypothetical protein
MRQIQLVLTRCLDLQHVLEGTIFCMKVYSSYCSSTQITSSKCAAICMTAGFRGNLLQQHKHKYCKIKFNKLISLRETCSMHGSMIIYKILSQYFATILLQFLRFSMCFSFFLFFPPLFFLPPPPPTATFECTHPCGL